MNLTQDTENNHYQTKTGKETQLNRETKLTCNNSTVETRKTKIQRPDQTTESQHKSGVAK